MKTYEEMTESILQKTEKRRAKLARRKRLLSLFAAVAAVVIVMTAIPVGALIIANRAQTPPEAGSETKTEFSTDRHPIADKKDISYICKMIITENPPSNINDITTTAVSPFDLPKGYGLFYEGERYLDFSEGLSGTIPADGGLLRRTYAQFAHEFTDDEDNYQVDIVFTDGVNEICHETYFGEKSLSGMINIIFDFYLFVPDHLEYGELRFYFNVLTNGAKAVPEFDDDPCNKMCVGFAQKYQCMRVSYGDETPSRDRKELEKSIDNNLHKFIYMCVDGLYALNNSRDIGMSAEREELAKEIYTSVLTLYKAENEEEYAGIVAEFCENEPERYDSAGNLTDKPLMRHDPLEDVADGER